MGRASASVSYDPGTLIPNSAEAELVFDLRIAAPVLKTDIR
jgi:hypothetical protein